MSFARVTHRELPLELPLMLPDEVSPAGAVAEPVSPDTPPYVLPELLPELPPEGAGVAAPGLLSLSAGGGVDGVDGAASGAVWAGGGVVPPPPCSVPALPPPPPRLQAARLTAIRATKTKNFDVRNFGFIPIPFNSGESHRMSS